jgi:peroxiredoxin
VAASADGRVGSQKTQAEHPHLTIVSDRDRRLIHAMGAVHPNGFPDGSDAPASTIVLVDPQGIVRWLYRPERALALPSPDEVLAAVARYLPAGR